MPQRSAVVYSKPGCPYCTRAIDLLRARNIPFKTIVMDPADVAMYKPLRDELVNTTGQKTFPFIYINNVFVGGYTELAASL